MEIIVKYTFLQTVSGFCRGQGVEGLVDCSNGVQGLLPMEYIDLLREIVGSEVEDYSLKKAKSQTSLSMGITNKKSEVCDHSRQLNDLINCLRPYRAYV
jgi:hypothetical protein